MGWLSELTARLRHDDSGTGPGGARERIESCVQGQIVPALEAIRLELLREGYSPEFEYGDDWASLAVTNFNGLPLEYRVQGHVYTEPVVNLSSVMGEGAEHKLKRYARIEIYSAGRTREYPLARCSRAAVERAARKYFRRFLLDSPTD